MGTVIKILYLLSGRLAPEKPHPPTSQKAMYKQCGTIEWCAGGMWKTWDFYTAVSTIIGMGPGIYCAFSLINVTKRCACQCAPRTLSPPGADSHQLPGKQAHMHGYTHTHRELMHVHEYTSVHKQKWIQVHTSSRTQTCYLTFLHF